MHSFAGFGCFLHRGYGALCVLEGLIILARAAEYGGPKAHKQSDGHEKRQPGVRQPESFGVKSRVHHGNRRTAGIVGNRHFLSLRVPQGQQSRIGPIARPQGLAEVKQVGRVFATIDGVANFSVCPVRSVIRQAVLSPQP
jgi:hypothetical protein